MATNVSKPACYAIAFVMGFFTIHCLLVGFVGSLPKTASTDSLSNINSAIEAESTEFASLHSRREDYDLCRKKLFDFMKGKVVTQYAIQFNLRELSLQPSSPLTIATDHWRKALPNGANSFYVCRCNAWGSWFTTFPDWSDYLIIACDDSHVVVDWILVARLPTE